MQKVQKTYTAEFKREAVQLAQTSGKPITQLARELGVSDTRVHQWRKELTEHGGFRLSRKSDIKRSKKRNCADSKASESEHKRSVTA